MREPVRPGDAESLPRGKPPTDARGDAGRGGGSGGPPAGETGASSGGEVDPAQRRGSGAFLGGEAESSPRGDAAQARRGGSDVLPAGEVDPCRRRGAGLSSGADAAPCSGAGPFPAGEAKPDPCPEGDLCGDLDLLQQWHALHSGVRRLTDGLLADVEAENGLAPSSFTALMFLVAAPGQAAPMNQLSQALGFSTGTTKVVDRLAEAGLVERRPSDSDRRVVYTALTSAGAERVLDASRALAQALRTRVVAPSARTSSAPSPPRSAVWTLPRTPADAVTRARRAA